MDTEESRPWQPRRSRARGVSGRGAPGRSGAAPEQGPATRQGNKKEPVRDPGEEAVEDGAGDAGLGEAGRRPRRWPAREGGRLSARGKGGAGVGGWSRAAKGGSDPSPIRTWRRDLGMLMGWASRGRSWDGDRVRGGCGGGGRTSERGEVRVGIGLGGARVRAGPWEAGPVEKGDAPRPWEVGRGKRPGGLLAGWLLGVVSLSLIKLI